MSEMRGVVKGRVAPRPTESPPRLVVGAGSHPGGKWVPTGKAAFGIAAKLQLREPEGTLVGKVRITIWAEARRIWPINRISCRRFAYRVVRLTLPQFSPPLSKPSACAATRVPEPMNAVRGNKDDI